MDPASRSTHAIFPPDNRTNPAEDGTQAKMDDVTLAHPIHGEPAQKRRRYNSRKTPAEWDLIKADLKKLYVDEDRSLEETIAVLHAHRGFEASKDQFKSKIKAWDFDKKIKTQEMKHIVRIDKMRIPKKTSFTVRKQPVNRFKIERFKKGHPALPEPPSRTPSVISYRTSYSPEGAPSLALTMSPRLGDFGWYQSYEEYRNQAPKYSTHPAFDILQKFQIQENTWQLRMFSKSQFLVFNTLLKQVSPGTVSEFNKDCSGCLFNMFAMLYRLGRDTYENDPNSLSAEPDLRWWISQVLRILQSRVETIGFQPILMALRWSLSEGIAIAADVFYEVGLDLCRAEELDDWVDIHYALEMVDHLILGGRLQAGEVLLRAIMKEDFGTIDVPSRMSEWDPQWDDEPMRSLYWDDEPMGLLYWRRAVAQLVIIRWFLAHPVAEHNVFGNNSISKYSTRGCGGLQVNNTHFCLAGRCHCDPEYFSFGEDFTKEDKVARDLIEGTDFQEPSRVLMRAMLGLSRYLPRYGHFLGISVAAQALDSEKQEEAGKEDENGTKDQGGTPFTQLQSGEHLPDRDQEEFDRWIVGSPLRASGYVVEMEDPESGEEGMRTVNQAFAEQRGDPFRNKPTSTGQWTDPPFEQANRAGSTPVQTQFTPWPLADYLIDPSLSMATFQSAGPMATFQSTEPMATFQSAGPMATFQSTGPFATSQSTEQTQDRDLDEEQTRMDTDPDF
ncbi:MAG: hypothetical protein Q9171_004678 [Xanthocarpia ochracea]